MKTRYTIILGTALLLGATASIGGFFYTRQIAKAYDLGSIIVEPAGPNPHPEIEPAHADERIADLSDRGDGARFVASAEDGETFFRIAFADDMTLIVSATSTEDGADRYRIFTLALDGGRAIFAESDRYLAASSHRPTHLNAETTCYAREDEKGIIDAWCRERGETDTLRLTEHNGLEAIREPAISPAGDWAVLQVDDMSRAVPAGSTIWKIGMNRAGIQQLTRGADDRYPTWSLDSKTLYFQRRVPGLADETDDNWDVYRMTAAGVNPEPILRTYDDDETWPSEVDAHRIVLASGPRGGSLRIGVLDIDSKSMTWLTSGAFGTETVPTVSPDRHLVAFIAPADSDRPGRSAIWVTEISE